MAFLKNVVNAAPDQWVPVDSNQIIDEPFSNGDPIPVTVSPNLRYRYSTDGIGEYLGPFGAGDEVPLQDGWLVAFEGLSPSAPGNDVFCWVKIGDKTHHVTISTRSGEYNGFMNTRPVEVALCNADGSLIEGAKVEIKLVGAADSAPPGTVSPGTFKRVTNGSGTATFALWSNQGHPSKTHYEIKSWHPETNKPIHTGQIFTVPSGAGHISIDTLIDIIN